MSRYILRHESKLLGSFRWESSGHLSDTSAVTVAIGFLVLMAGIVTQAPYWHIAIPQTMLGILYLSRRQ